jgi:hypothetical protein
MWQGTSILSMDCSGLSGHTGISMPALTNRGIHKWDYSSPNGRKIVNEVFTRIEGGDAEMPGALPPIAVRQPLPDATVCGWRANQLWRPNNTKNRKGDNLLFTDADEQIMAGRIPEQYVKQHRRSIDQDFKFFVINEYDELHPIDGAAANQAARDFVLRTTQ